MMRRRTGPGKTACVVCSGVLAASLLLVLSKRWRRSRRPSPNAAAMGLPPYAGPVPPQYVQPQQQRPGPVQPHEVSSALSHPRLSTGQVPNPADGHGREQAYPPRSNQPHR